MNKKDEDRIEIRIASPEKVLWEGAGFAVSSKNSQGKFDILPHHASFLTIVEDQPIKISSQRNKVLQEFRFPQALIYNRDNKVSVYTLGKAGHGPAATE